MSIDEWDVYSPWDVKIKKASEIVDDSALARWVEGYAAAIADMAEKLSGDSMGGKSYDPMFIDRKKAVMHSYAFNMRDGGRHHALCDYEIIGDIVQELLNEGVNWVREQ